ncbi:MAG: hypothetical protein JSV61_12815 [Anaerolineales bacterium]|nr:MAG: hypothetical protein JSV61_12815 [Anaerolineales bacterium]
MNNEPNEQGKLRNEFRDLGENLAQTLRSAWESPERKQLQNEVEEGLTSITESLKREIESFKESQTGQRLKSDIEDLRHRVDSGEVETKVREELLKALQFINTELRKISGQGGEAGSAGVKPEDSGTTET